MWHRTTQGEIHFKIKYSNWKRIVRTKRMKKKICWVFWVSKFMDLCGCFFSVSFFIVSLLVLFLTVRIALIFWWFAWPYSCLSTQTHKSNNTWREERKKTPSERSRKWNPMFSVCLSWMILCDNRHINYEFESQATVVSIIIIAICSFVLFTSFAIVCRDR